MRVTRRLGRTAGAVLAGFVLALVIGAMEHAEAQAPLTLKVGILPIIPMTPLRTAEKLGYFKEEGVELQLQTFQGGAVALPALLNKQVDITYSNYVSVVQLAQQGGKLRVIAGGTSSWAKTPDAGSLLVGQDSPVKSLRDLPGKTLALNTLRSIEHVSIKQWLRNNGIDPNSVKYVEVPWVNQADAYKQGSIQVLSVIEPFQSRYVNQMGFRVVGYFYEAWKIGVPLAGWVVMQEWLNDKKDHARRFARAIERAVQYLRQNPAEERKLMEEFFKLPKPVVGGIVVNDYTVKVNPAAAQILLDAMVEDGVLKTKVNFAELLHDTAR